jgi:hypothetical protein
MMGRPPGFSVGFLPGMMGPGGMMSSAGLPAVHPAVALRVRDGKRLKIKGLANKLQGALRLEGTRITWIRNGGSVRLLGLSWTQLFVQQDDVITGKTLWQHKLESDSRLTTLGDDQLVLLESNGRLGRLDLSTGKLSPVGQIATSDLKGASNIYAFQDALNLYVAVNKPLKGSYYSVNMHSIRVNGPLLAFARNASGGPPRGSEPRARKTRAFPAAVAGVASVHAGGQPAVLHVEAARAGQVDRPGACEAGDAVELLEFQRAEVEPGREVSGAGLVQPADPAGRRLSAAGFGEALADDDPLRVGLRSLARCGCL